MTSSTGHRGVLLGAALAGVLLLPACAQGPGGAGSEATPTPTPTPTSASPSSAAVPEEGLVLLAEHVGGFTTPQYLVGRLPLVAVYADGRVITQGPVAAVHPGPALPNLQVDRVEPARVRELVDQALAAGVGDQRDLGMPPIADVPSTRFTAVTDEGTATSEVYALDRSLEPAPGEPLPGLTEEQVAARAELQDLLDALVAAGSGASEPYEPEAVAAVVSEWTDAGDGLPPPEPVAWPGPPLPGEALDERLGVHCVTARDAAAEAVLDAAAEATSATPWTSEDGDRWSLVLRPLLPHEDGCADLPDR